MAKKLTVASEMTTHLVTIQGTASIEEAYELMYANKIRHLPVLDRTGTVEGIISDRDVQRAMISDISDSFGFKMESVKFKPEARVLDYMTWPVKTYTDDTDLREVLQGMLQQKVSAYLITRDNNVVGIVTTDDLLQLLLHLLQDDEEENQILLGDVLSSPLFGRMANIVSNAGI
jgi:CBS domain-containing protein